jgi:hypothetical protein
MPIDSARRGVPIRLVGVGVATPNGALAVPAQANALYIGNAAYITFDGTTASATNGIRVSTSMELTKPVLIPQGATLNIFGDAAPTYVQFCQVTAC